MTSVQLVYCDFSVSINRTVRRACDQPFLTNKNHNQTGFVPNVERWLNHSRFSYCINDHLSHKAIFYPKAQHFIVRVHYSTLVITVLSISYHDLLMVLITVLTNVNSGFIN